MMRSLFSGVSGLKAHQTGMDVIGNNIANVNTTGYKSSRTTFADMFSQTLAGASKGNGGVVGGTNPKQIGLGSVVASIDMLFTDGSTQSTGKNTDMALQGNGLFVVKQGKQTYYTRNGDFQFDQAGNFVNSAGLFVQGWMAQDGVIKDGSTTSTNMTNIVLNGGKPMDPKKTTTTTYTNNLNSAAATIGGMTVLDSNGNTIKVASSDATQWEVGADHVANIENLDATFIGNITIGSARGQYAMGNTYSFVDGSLEVTLKNGDVIKHIKKTSTNQYTVGSSAPTIETVTYAAAGPTVTFKNDGGEIDKSSSSYTVTLNNGDTIELKAILGTYTKGQVIPNTTVYSVHGSTVTLGNANGDTLTNNSGTTYKGTIGGADTIVISANSTGTYTTGSAPTGVTVKSVNGRRITLSDGSVITAATNANAANYIPGQAVPGAVTFTSTAPTSSVKSITANDAPLVSEIAGKVTSGSGDQDSFDVKTSGAYIKPSANLTVSGITMTDENGSVVTVSSSDTAAYKASTTTSPQTYTASAPKSISLNMSDGTSVMETAGAYNVGYSMPVATTIKAYDTLGNEHNVTLYFTKTRTDSNTGNQWTVSINPNGKGETSIKESDGTTTKVTMNDVTLQFDTDGNYLSGATSTNLLLSNGSELNQSIVVDLTQLTQYAGDSTVTNTSDGNAKGNLSSVSIDNQGRIIGTYTNDVQQVEGQVAVAQFSNAAGLTKTGNSLYQESNNSGGANINTNTALGVGLTTSALEMSNVDVANEFSQMIITQRGFQSNSKIITVSDEMLETLINMKR